MVRGTFSGVLEDKNESVPRIKDKGTMEVRKTPLIVTASIVVGFICAILLADNQDYPLTSTTSEWGVTYQIYVDVEVGDQLNAVYGDGDNALSVDGTGALYQSLAGQATVVWGCCYLLESDPYVKPRFCSLWIRPVANNLLASPHNMWLRVPRAPLDVTLGKTGIMGLRETNSRGCNDLPNSNGDVPCPWKQPVQVTFI